MKLNKLYHSILNAQWLLHFESIFNYADLIQRIADGDFKSLEADPADKPEMAISYLDDSNRRYAHDFENPENMPEKSVAVIEMIGVFTKYGNICQYGAEEYASMINMAMANPKVIGVIIETDSGGGAANAVAPWIQALANRTKPVLDLCDTCGSAAYFKAAATDHIMAANNISAMFGSIGVMFSLRDARPKLEAEGYKFHTVYAPESEHKNKAFELLLEGKYDMIREEIMSPMARQFQNFVRQQRGNKLKEETGVLTGKMFFAEDAVQVGLADSIGNMKLANEKVRELASDKKLMLRLAARSMFN